MSTEWQPIETVPENEHVLIYWPIGERGVGTMDCATILRCPVTGEMTYWTSGGTNAGSDFEPCNGELPTHWQPLPGAPA